MCIGIPMQVVSTEGSYAWCDSRNGRSRINTMLVGDVQPGQWLLAFLDTAREAIDAEHAALVNGALDALEIVAAGGDDFDRCFADLVGREPQLPEFLKQETKHER